jgi:hypothetical protein
MRDNHNPSTHINSLSKAVISQLEGINATGDAKTQLVDESGNVIGATSNALDVNVKSDGAGLALDDTLTDGSQKNQIVDGSGNVIGSTSNALDVNIKSGGATLDVNLDNANDDVLIYGFDGAVNQKVLTHTDGKIRIHDINEDVNVTATDLDIRDLANASDNVLIYGYDGADNQKIKTHTDGAVQIKSIADSVAVTTDVETGLAKDATLKDGSQKSKIVDSAGVSSDVVYRTFRKTVTRPANTTAYNAADVIGDVSEALDSFADVAKAAGYGVCVTNVRIFTTDTGLSGKTIRVHFLSDIDTPIADNAAFAIGDGAKRRGYVDVEVGTGALAAEGQANAENILINPVTRAVYFILETTEGFTPSADSTTVRVEIGCILSN